MRATEGWQTPGLPPGRSMGAALRLDPEVPSDGARVGFELAAQNGADEFSSNNDNDALALSAAVIARFPHDGWLSPRGGGTRARSATCRSARTRPTSRARSARTSRPARCRFGGGADRAAHDVRDHRRAGAGRVRRARAGHGPRSRRACRSRSAIGSRVLDPSSLIMTDRVIEHTAARCSACHRIACGCSSSSSTSSSKPARDLDERSHPARRRGSRCEARQRRARAASDSGAVLRWSRCRPARRRRIRARSASASSSETIGGPHAIGQIGDFLLENDQVRFIIADKGVGRVNTTFGGTLVDADLQRVGGDDKGNDQLAELLPGFVFTVIDPTDVSRGHRPTAPTARPAEVTVHGRRRRSVRDGRAAQHRL